MVFLWRLKTLQTKTHKSTPGLDKNKPKGNKMKKNQKNQHQKAATILSIREKQMKLYKSILKNKTKKIKKAVKALFSESEDYVNSNLTFMTTDEADEIQSILFLSWTKEVFESAYDAETKGV